MGGFYSAVSRKFINRWLAPWERRTVWWRAPLPSSLGQRAPPGALREGAANASFRTGLLSLHPEQVQCLMKLMKVVEPVLPLLFSRMHYICD